MSKNSRIAYELGKIVHENCKDVPHDIGILLSEKVDEIMNERCYFPLYNGEKNPFDDTINNFFMSNKVCEKCSSNPKNGGTGICNCILGMEQIK